MKGKGTVATEDQGLVPSVALVALVAHGSGGKVVQVEGIGRVELSLALFVCRGVQVPSLP